MLLLCLKYLHTFLKLPTNLSNVSIIYIQVATIGSQQLGIMGGASPQNNMYYGLNTWKGYEYASSPTIYKFTYYSPSSNNPWYGDTNYTFNSWKMDTVFYIPLSSSSTLHNISTSNVAINGIYQHHIMVK